MNDALVQLFLSKGTLGGIVVALAIVIAILWKTWREDLKRWESERTALYTTARAADDKHVEILLELNTKTLNALLELKLLIQGMAQRGNV